MCDLHKASPIFGGSGSKQLLGEYQYLFNTPLLCIVEKVKLSQIQWDIAGLCKSLSGDVKFVHNRFYKYQHLCVKRQGGVMLFGTS